MRIVVALDNADKYLAVWESVVDLGVDVHVVAPAAIASRLTERPGLTVHRVPDRFVRRGRETWRILPGLGTIIRSVDPDLVHLTTEPWSVTALQALTTRRRVVVHGAEIVYRSGTPAEIAIRAALCRATLPRLAGYVAWNSLALRTARAEGLPVSTPSLVAPAEVPEPAPFGPARSRRALVRSSNGWSDDEFIVGFVGRYSPEKGLGWLVRAAEAVTTPHLRFACFGEGPDIDVVRDAAHRSGGRLRDHGPVAFERIPEVMAALDALVIPSVATDGCLEQFGRVAVEAMLAGTPIVSSDSGALPEVVGDAGRLIPEADVDALARALDEISGSPGECAELIARGYERASRHFDPPTVADRLVSLWQRVIAGDRATTIDHRRSSRTDRSADVPSRPVIAVMMASHDRVDSTLRCLESLREQTDLDAEVEVFLVDDGSADGTADAVRARYGGVHVLQGNGSLFWSGAMRLAQTAARRIEPDFLLWLNDDVVLDPDALSRLLQVHARIVSKNGPLSIVVGGLRDPDTGSVSYAGVVRPDRVRRARFEMVEPSDAPVRCDAMHGNLVLVPESVFRRLDGFDGAYRHAMSDFDFGLRATAQGCGVWLAPGTFGACRRDHDDQPWIGSSGSLLDRTRLLLSPKGLPPADWWRFTRRHTGALWPLAFASPYGRFVARSVRQTARLRRRPDPDGVGHDRPERR